MKKRNRSSKYDQYIDYIREHIVKDGVEAVAEHIGVKKGSLARRICDWRKSGICIPNIRKVPVGTISTRLDRGIAYQYVKTASGWERGQRITPYGVRVKREKPARPPKLPKRFKPVKEAKAPVVKLPKPPKTTLPRDSRRHVKPEQKRLPDRVITAPMKLVRVDKKTQLEVPVTANDQEVIERYYNRLQSSQR